MSKAPNLSRTQLDTIAELRGVKGLSVEAIARRIHASHGAVAYGILRLGVEKPGDEAKILPPVPEVRPSYQRNGRTVLGFNRADDEALLELEAEGLTYGEIGRRMVPRRGANTVQGRLLTLARRDARAEAAQQ